MIDLFFKNWPDCPYQVFLVANHITLGHPKVTMLMAGDDKDWSTTMVKAISTLKQTHILFWMDDFFLTGPVSTVEIDYLFKIFIDKQMSFLRLRPSPPASKWLDATVGQLAISAAYRVSLPVTI